MSTQVVTTIVQMRERIAAALSSTGRPTISSRARNGWRSSLATLPGIGLAFLPKIACPACWPAYAGLLSSLGLGFLLDVRWLFPGEAWRFYAGSGISAHFLSTEVDAPQFGLNEANDSLTKGGMTLLLGAWFGSRAQFGNFIEAKAHLVGGYRQVKINFGLSWSN